MIKHIGRAIAQFTSPGTWGVILLSILVTGLAFVVLFLGATWGLAQIPEMGWTWFGWSWAWVDNVIAFVASLIVAVAFIFLLIPVSAVTLGFFVEDIANRVEDRWYGGRGEIRDPGIGEILIVVIRFFAALIFFNLLVLPLYLIPFVNVVVYVVLNGMLVGREFFEMVALRHMPPREVAAARKKNRFTLFSAGVVTTLALSIPVVNFVAPVFGAALMVHVYKELAGNGRL